MKLKIFLFPISILFATVVFSWFVWPMWFDSSSGVLAIKKEIKEKRDDLGNVMGKQGNIRKLKADIERNSDIKDFVYQYLPKFRKKEFVLNDLSRMANSSQVLLAEFQFTEGEAFKTGVANKFDSKDELAIVTINDDGENVEMNSKKDSKGDNEKLNKPSAVIASIKLFGQYENMKDFLSRIHNASMMNNVLSVKIDSVLPDEKEEELEEFSDKTSVLEMDVVVAFGYMEKKNIIVNENLSDSIFGKSSMDFSIIAEQMKEVVENKSVEIESAGKDNPFSY